MNSRERYLAAVEGKPVDRLPLSMSAVAEIDRKLKAHFGTDDLNTALNLDRPGVVRATYGGPTLPVLSDGESENFWGIRFRMTAHESGAYKEQVFFPLAAAKSLDDLVKFRWPQAEWFDCSAMEAEARSMRKDRAVLCGYMCTFYLHNQLRGLEQSLLDPLEDPEFTHELLSRSAEFVYRYHRRMFESCPGLIDLCEVTDDLGSQTGPMMSIETYREFYKPHHRRFISLCREFGIKVFHHDCGSCRLYLPDLVEMGINILDPLQKTCPGMDLRELKQTFGGKLCFHGGVENQKVLPFGTPEEVRADVRSCIDALAPDRTGYIVAPCHAIQSNTPVENILALFDEALEYGDWDKPRRSGRLGANLTSRQRESHLPGPVSPVNRRPMHDSVPDVSMSRKQPNILLIVSDDHRWCDSGVYGNTDVHMPSLSRLASEGMRFDNYYSPSPICAPARMSLYSGLFPVRNGGWPNHSQCYDGTRSMAHHLGALGYRVGLHGKRHVGPEGVFPFEKVDRVADFMHCNPEQPYCLVIATRKPHTPWGDIIGELYDPERIALSPNLVDTPQTRHSLARYYSDLTRLDAAIGEYVALVDASRDPENTVVIYTSDHGAQLPGGKWTCYEPGLRVPFIMRWPARVKPGSVASALVQHVDVLPTLAEIAGGDPDAIDTGRDGAWDGGRGFDGKSFLPVLLGETVTHRDLVFGVHTQHGTINGLPYPVRSVSNGKYKYILNLCSESTYRNALTGPPNADYVNAYWQEWLAAAGKDRKATFLVDRYLHRPNRELYDLEHDPWEFRNLAAVSDLSGVMDALSSSLGSWMRQQVDKGLETELLALSRQRS